VVTACGQMQLISASHRISFATCSKEGKRKKVQAPMFLGV
jgi:hypothetical protein